MSRGLGKVQRAILSKLEEERIFPYFLGGSFTPPNIFDSITIAGKVHDKTVVSKSEISSVRRSLRKLVKSEHLIGMGRNWPDGRRRYALPKEAEHLNKLEEKGLTWIPPCNNDYFVEGTEVSQQCAIDDSFGRGEIKIDGEWVDYKEWQKNATLRN